MEKENIPALVDIENCSDENTSDSDEEMETAGGEPTRCLFCVELHASINEAIAHLQQKHGIDLAQLKAKFQMDQYSFLKLINFIRSDDAIDGKTKAKRLASSDVVYWDDEKYLKPKEYEPWLSYDYEEDLPACSVSADDTVSELKRQLADTLDKLAQSHADMRVMRLGFQRLVENQESNPNSSKQHGHFVGAVSLRADEGYFGSYAHFGIHHEMLSDVVRTTSYRDALLKNRNYIAGKDVLDVGCGTSVLSIFASQAGAKSVVGIDNSDIIYNAMDIVKRNNINNVQLIKGRLENTELPQQKFDIIISEWMGYFLLFEGMLDSVIYARDHHLKEGGKLLPNRCTMSLLGYGNDALYKQHVRFWDNVYGLDMCNMRKDVMQEPLIDIVDAQHILTTANQVSNLDLDTVDLNYSNFSYDFHLKCEKPGNLSAFVGYFDTFFELPEELIMFSTSPTSPATHWKQVVFFVEHPQAVSAGDVISGTLTCQRSKHSARSLDITIEAFGRRHMYYLD